MKGSIENLPGTVYRNEYEETPGAILIDVRTPMEFEQGHLANAINIDFMSQNFVQEFSKLDKDKVYYLYCRSGNRSGQAGMLLANMGYQTKNLIGGISEWPENSIAKN